MNSMFKKMRYLHNTVVFGAVFDLDFLDDFNHPKVLVLNQWAIKFMANSENKRAERGSILKKSTIILSLH